VPKLRLDFPEEKTKKVVKNYRALNILFCGLDSNEFNHMFTCDTHTTKEVWDILETTYEGTSHVQEFKVSPYVHQDELLKMLYRESIKDMCMCFTEIINSFKSLGKAYTNEEKVREVLRCLPRSKQGPKVAAIEKYKI